MGTLVCKLCGQENPPAILVYPDGFICEECKPQWIAWLHEAFPVRYEEDEEEDEE